MVLRAAEGKWVWLEGATRGILALGMFSILTVSMSASWIGYCSIVVKMVPLRETWLKKKKKAEYLSVMYHYLKII